jgi:hypothetical protein
VEPRTRSLLHTCSHQPAYITFFHVMMSLATVTRSAPQDTQDTEEITQSIPRGPQAMNDGDHHDGNL